MLPDVFIEMHKCHAIESKICPGDVKINDHGQERSKKQHGKANYLRRARQPVFMT